jgi:hypothetical protein
MATIKSLRATAIGLGPKPDFMLARNADRSIEPKQLHGRGRDTETEPSAVKAGETSRLGALCTSRLRAAPSAVRTAASVAFFGLRIGDIGHRNKQDEPHRA